MFYGGFHSTQILIRLAGAIGGYLYLTKVKGWSSLETFAFLFLIQLSAW